MGVGLIAVRIGDSMAQTLGSAGRAPKTRGGQTVLRHENKSLWPSIREQASIGG
jgi:hypothetical protein